MDKKTLDELEARRAAGRRMGGPDRLERLAKQNKLDARTRLDILLDPGSFSELGVLG